MPKPADLSPSQEFLAQGLGPGDVLRSDVEEWERRVLNYNPFADDKDDGGYRMLRDRIVTARAGGQCAECAGEVAPGTRIRVMTAASEEHVASSRSCHLCCDAMAAWMLGDFDPLEERIHAGRESRGCA
jgi:hypothetical protein